MAQVQINLLTKEFRNRGVSDSGVKWIVILAVLGMLGLAGWQFLQMYQLTGDQSSYQAELTILQKKVVPVQQDITRADGVNHLQNVVKNLHSTGPEMNQLLAAIQGQTPAGIDIKSLSINNGQMDMQVEASALSYVQEFHDSLATVKGFTNVQLKSLSQDSGKPAQAALSLSYGKEGWSK